MDKLEGLLFRFGIYRCQEGYDCILAAMELVEEDETLLKRLIGGLYPAAAAKIAHRSITQPPTAGDFLCMLHEYLREQKARK